MITEGTPVDAVLRKWLPQAMLSGKRVFDAVAVVRDLGPERLSELMLDLDALLHSVVAPRQGIHWQLPVPAQGEAIAYVPPGPNIGRRMVNAALFVDHVLVGHPEVPQWGVYAYGPADILKHSLDRRQGRTRSTGRASRDSFDTDLDSFLDQLDDELDNAAGTLLPMLPDLAADLLAYWWAVRVPLAQGWMHVVGQGLLNSDNVKDVARDPVFRVELDKWSSRWQSLDSRPWSEVMTTTGLARSLHREYVTCFTSTDASRDLLALTSRYYTALPYGGVMMGRWLPTPRSLTAPGGREVVRGAWFDEILVGLGPKAEYLDMQAAVELRDDGVAAELQAWVSGDLSRVAFADDGEANDVLAECRNRFAVVVSHADRRLQRTQSQVLRARLRQAGIWGSSGAASNFVGTVMSGGEPSLAAALGGVGFALGAMAAAAATSTGSSDTREPVLHHIVGRLHSRPK